jgi:hypothetical protein
LVVRGVWNRERKGLKSDPNFVAGLVKKGKKNLRAYKEKERINLIWIFCWQFCFHKGKTILLMSVLDYYQGDWTGFGGAARLLP